MTDINLRLTAENLASEGVREVTSSLRELSGAADDANAAEYLLTHSNEELAAAEEQTAEAARAWDEAHGEGVATAEAATSVLGDLTEALRLSQADYKAGIITLTEYKEALARIRQEAIAYRSETGLAGREISTFNTLMGQTGEKVTAAHIPLGRLRFQLTTLATQAAGLSGSGGTIARIGSSFLGVFGGTGPAIIVVATLAAIIAGLKLLDGDFSAHAKRVAELEKSYGKYKDAMELTRQTLSDIQTLEDEVQRQRDKTTMWLGFAGIAPGKLDIVEDSKATTAAREAESNAIAKLNKSADEEINKLELQIEGFTRSKNAVELFRLAMQGADEDHRRTVADLLTYITEQKIAREGDLDAAKARVEVARATFGMGAAADAAQIALVRLKEKQAVATDEEIRARTEEEARQLARARQVETLKELRRAGDEVILTQVRQRAVIEGWSNARLNQELDETKLRLKGLGAEQAAAVSSADAHAAALAREEAALTKLVAELKVAGTELSAGLFAQNQKEGRASQIAGGLSVEERAAGRPGGLTQGIGVMGLTGEKQKADAEAAHSWVLEMQRDAARLRSEFSLMNDVLKKLTTDANLNLGSMASMLDDIGSVSLVGLSAGFSKAMQGMVEQGRFSGKEFAKGMIQGIAQAAGVKAGYYFAEGLAALAAVTFPIPNPANAVSAGHYFAAAAEMTAVAAVAGAAASAIHTGGGGGGGGGGAAQTSAVAGMAGSAMTVVVPSMMTAQPEFVDWLVSVLEQAGGRRVTVTTQG